MNIQIQIGHNGQIVNKNQAMRRIKFHAGAAGPGPTSGPNNFFFFKL